MQITSSYFCAGLTLNDRDIVVRAAPILHYMVGWNKETVFAYCRKKNWKCVET